MILSEYRSNMGWTSIEKPKSSAEFNEWYLVQIEELRDDTVMCAQCHRPFFVSDPETSLLVALEDEGDEGFGINATVVCDACIEEHKYYSEAKRCDLCGVKHTTTYPSPDGKVYCLSCVQTEDEVKSCTLCHKIVDDDSLTLCKKTDGTELGLVCEECIKRSNICPACLTYGAGLRYSYTALVDGKAKKIEICSSCSDDKPSITRCSICREYFERDLLEPIGVIGGVCCHHCRKAIKVKCSSCGVAICSKHNLCAMCQTGHIRAWNYAPDAFTFHGNEGPYYGIELELTGFPNPNKREDRPRGKKLLCALELYEMSRGEEDFYLMVDSTTNGGFEIAFQPRSLHSWMTEGLIMLNKVVAIARKYSAVSYKGGSCGIHIHRSMTDIPTGLGLATLFYSVQALEPYALILAQRTSVSNYVDIATNVLTVGEYGNFVRMKKFFPDNQVNNDAIRKLLRESKKWQHDIGKDHHAAITFGNGKKTIELRIFRGTLNVTTIFAYLSFYHLLAEWSKEANLTKLMKWQNATSWLNFSEFVRNQQTEASVILQEYAKTKGVLL